ncbi:MAG: hypothetical protein U0W40_06515 [Acidimicrobiia bacterium]
MARTDQKVNPMGRLGTAHHHLNATPTGLFEPAVHELPGLPVPTREDAPLADEESDGKSYRIGRTEQMLEMHPTATYRYLFVHGRASSLREETWCAASRRLSVLSCSPTALDAHPARLRRQPRLAARGRPARAVDGREIFNRGDDEKPRSARSWSS